MLIRRNKDYLCLFFLWFGILIHNSLWLKYDNSYFTHDSHRHFLASLKMYEILRTFSLRAVPLSIDTFQLHPPLVMIVTAPFYFLFGVNQDVGAMVNSMIFFGILIFATYGIGLKTADRKIGLLAAFIVSMYPVIFNQLKIYMLDLPLTAMVTLSIYFLLCCDNFKNIKYSILFSICAGLGMLTKDSFLIYLIGPLSYSIIKSVFLVRQEGNNLKKHIGYLVLLGFLIISTCSIYYLTNFYKVLSKACSGYIRTWPTSVPSSGLFLHILRAFLWYFWGFINWQVSFFYFIVFLIGIFFFVHAKVKNKGVFVFWTILSWILVSSFRYAVGFNMEVTGVRYIMPILPAIALISSAGIMQIPVKRIRYSLIYLIIIFGISQLLFISYPITIKRFTRKLSLSINFPERIKKYKIFPEEIILFNFKDWTVSGRASGSHPRDFRDYFIANEEIFKIVNSSKGNKEANSIFIIPDDTRLWYLQYKVYIEKKPFQIFCDWNYLRINMMRKGFGIPILILNSDYIIDKDNGFLGEPYVQPFVTTSRVAFGLYKNRFILLKQVKWPDGSNILVYKKIN